MMLVFQGKTNVYSKRTQALVGQTRFPSHCQQLPKIESPEAIVNAIKSNHLTRKGDLQHNLSEKSFHSFFYCFYNRPRANGKMYLKGLNGHLNKLFIF